MTSNLLFNRLKLYTLAMFCTYLLITGTVSNATESALTPKPNVLFILIDDMRVNYGPYAKRSSTEDTVAVPLTPHIDQLAREAAAFNRAYSNVPVCGASRASMLTGIWPSKDRFLAFSPADTDVPDAISLPGYFKNNGYTTISLGKVFNNQFDKESGWSSSPWRPSDNFNLNGKQDKRAYTKAKLDYQTKAAQDIFDQAIKNGPAFESADVDDFTYLNGQIAQQAMTELEQLNRQEQPFFLAVGLKKPHLPFNAPKKYWDYYQAEQLPQASSNHLPLNAPIQAQHHWGELRNYHGIAKKGPVPDELAKKLVHGYFAATSYSDALVGQILAKLKKLSLADNTIVVLWGDHGWSLGEHGLWAKHSPFNIANQIPLIIKAPGLPAGTSVENITESVDIYPTLVELAGLPPLSTLDGTSLVAQLKDPTAAGKEFIVTRWRNSDTIRSTRFHYTEWRDKKGQVSARMLYDHDTDPDELINVAEQADYQADVVRLHQLLQQHIDRLAHK